MAAAPSSKLSLPGAASDSSDVTAFISKVWKIVEKPEYDHLISWSEGGKTFIVHDGAAFASDVLPLYFKHSNLTSFVRQLNIYGFRKVAKMEQGSLAKMQSSEPLEFWHTNFRRGHPELLQLVQRRNRCSQPQKTVSTRTAIENNTPQISRVMTDIHQMKGRQDSIASLLDTMRKENQEVRMELALMKDKHQQQQRVLNKIIQFLVHMVYKGKLPSTRRRSARLMLPDPDSQPPLPKRLLPLRDTSITAESADIYDIQSPEMLSAVQSVSSPQGVGISPVASPQLSQAIDTPATSEALSSSQPPPLTSSLALATYNPSIFSHPSAGGVATMPTSSPDAQSRPVPLLMPMTSDSGNGDQIPLEEVVINALEAPLDGAALSLPSDFLASEFHLLPAPPSSLVPSSVPQSRLRISGHLDTQQQGLQALPDLLSEEFSVDPTIISQFISTDDPCPEYNYIDTARLLESLSDSSGLSVTDERSLLSSLASSSLTLPTFSSSSSSSSALVPVTSTAAISRNSGVL